MGALIIAPCFHKGAPNYIIHIILLFALLHKFDYLLPDK